MVGGMRVVVAITDHIAEVRLLGVGVNATTAVTQDIVDLLSTPSPELIAIQSQVSTKESKESGVGSVTVGSPWAVEGQALGSGLHRLPGTDIILEAIGILLVLGDLIHQKLHTSGLAIPNESPSSRLIT